MFDLARDLGGALEDLCRGQPERDELFAALLAQVTGDDRLDVIVIEDIHWADEATLDLMRFLTRRIRAAPVRVIATYRDDWLAPSSPLRLALGDLAARRWARRLELPPLSVEAVRTMAAGTGLDAGQLHQLSASGLLTEEGTGLRFRHASLAARQAVDLGSHREAAAQYERALRWAAHTAPSAQADLYTGLAEERLSATKRKPRPKPTSRRYGSGGCSKIAATRASRCSDTR